MRAPLIVAVAVLLWTPVASAQPLVIDTEMLRLAINEDGTLQSLRMAGSETELGRPGLPIALARTDEVIQVTSVAVDGQRLTYTFGDTGIRAVVSWEDVGGMPVFTLHEIEGAPERLDFLTVPVLEGGQLRCANRAVETPDGGGVALIGATQECLIAGDGTPRLFAAYSAEVPVLPLRAGLLAARWDAMPEAIMAAEEHFDIPLGMRAKLSDAARGTYLMIGGVTHANVDQVIYWASRGGFGSILMLHGTWGHYGRRYAVPEAAFPGGIQQLTAAIDRMHDAGLLAGAHMFSSKFPKHSLNNVPDAETRFWEDQHVILARPLDAEADRIFTTEPPTRWPVTTGTRDIRIGGEMMTYTSLVLEEPFGFSGVERGAYGTVARAHEAGAEVWHVMTDEARNIFIINQDTDLLDEHTANIARTYNAAGFDWIYYDGAEDVHPPRWYTTSNAKLAVIEKLEREPALTQTAASGPFSWHLVTRVGQRDYFWVSPWYKDEIDDAIARGWARARRDLMVADLGWFPLNVRGPGGEHIRPTQVDDVEYLCARALASDSAYSILTSVDRMKQATALDALLHVMARYEHHKFAGTFPESLKARILEPRQDWMLIEREGEEPRLVNVREMPYVGGSGHLVRAFITTSPHRGVNTVSLAPVRANAQIEFSLDPRRLTFTDYAGNPLEVEVRPGARVVVPVRTRVFMHCDGISSHEIRGALRSARCTQLKPRMVFVDAGEPLRIEGDFTTLEAAGLSVEGTMGGAILPSGPFNAQTGPQHWAEYEVDVPVAGSWMLWIRTMYHDTNSNSFFLWDPENPQTPIRLGNRIGDYDRWIWEGPLEVNLPAGRSVLRITGRESRPLVSPVLDLIALVHDDWSYQPTDGDAREAVGD